MLRVAVVASEVGEVNRDLEATKLHFPLHMARDVCALLLLAFLADQSDGDRLDVEDIVSRHESCGVSGLVSVVLVLAVSHDGLVPRSGG